MIEGFSTSSYDPENGELSTDLSLDGSRDVPLVISPNNFNRFVYDTGKETIIEDYWP